MNILKSRFLCALAGCLMVVLGAPPALADDSEVFNSSTFTTGSGVLPNVLFVIDTSGSMDTEVVVYDPSITYTGPCDKDVIYWQTANNKKPPECTTTQFITKAANRCRAAYLGMASNGWWRGRSQQLNGIDSAATVWQNLVAGQKNRLVECQSDRGNHGNVAANLTDNSGSSGKKYARNGSGTGYANRWGVSGDGSNISNNSWDGKQNISFYDGNYANYFYGGGPGARTTRLDIVRTVATDLIQELSGVNLGLARYSNDQGDEYEETAEGGMITFPVSKLTPEVRTAMITELNSYVPAGNTPLSETYYEAYQYLAGGPVLYGDTAKLNKDTPYPSVPTSRVDDAADGKQYKSPMDYNCQKTFIVYLTDGLPTADNSADDEIIGEFAAASDDDGLTTCPERGPDGTRNGRCMVNLAKYMFHHDSNAGIEGVQNITTYVVGFGDDIATSADFLEDVAEAGGGKAYTQTDAAGLTATLAEIFSEVASDTNTTFVSPTVAVNAFNRARNLDSLFVSVFSPSKRLHWPGNLKKYQLHNGMIVGKNKDNPAVDPTTGFFASDTTDLFNEGTGDGAEVEAGGTASRIPAGTDRKVYTYLGGSSDLKSDDNAVSDGNDTLMDAPEKLGLATSATEDETRRLISFIRGVDTQTDAASTAARHAMGDPMRTRPAVAIYGGTETEPTGTVFTTTNDGVLHAFSMSTGDELWAFIPEEFLSIQADLFNDVPTATRRYAVDGDVRLLRYDANKDNKITPGTDKMYAIFGFGRGGSVYYALDVTSQEAPTFLWKKNKTDLPRLGQAWSAPVITRVNVGGGVQTDPQKIVMIFGGGYDESQENYSYVTDGSGNAIYMLEVATGNLLWSAGQTGANFNNAAMNNAIPGDISVIDMDGDGYADRMYAGDMGGRIWRFDIWHGEEAAMLVSGGVLATLGAGHVDDPTLEVTRRFYYAPDVSVVTPRGSAPFMNIAIGSGYRGHPLETDTEDRFYAIRDYAPFTRRLNASYGTPITDDDLVDVTQLDGSGNFVEVPDGAKGWKLLLNLDGWRGEKVLAESVTANGVIFFPTFTPTGVDEENPCLPATENRTYAVFLDSAKPFGLRDGENPGDPPERDDPRDRYIELLQGGIAPGLAVIQTPDDKTLCLEGVEAIGRCIDLGDVVRTFWERRQ